MKNPDRKQGRCTRPGLYGWVNHDNFLLIIIFAQNRLRYTHFPKNRSDFKKKYHSNLPCQTRLNTCRVFNRRSAKNPTWRRRKDIVTCPLGQEYSRVGFSTGDWQKTRHWRRRKDIGFIVLESSERWNVSKEARLTPALLRISKREGKTLFPIM